MPDQSKETELKPCATNLEAMIVAYGKLWRDVPSTHKAVQARMVLKDRLTHAERKTGIQLALEEYGPPTKNDILTLDHPRTPDTAQYTAELEETISDQIPDILDLTAERAQLLKDREELESVLKELCGLKTYRDKWGKDAQYERAKPLVWARARSLLARLSRSKQEDQS